MARLDPPRRGPPKPQAPSSVNDIWLWYSIILIYPISTEYYNSVNFCQASFGPETFHCLWLLFRENSSPSDPAYCYSISYPVVTWSNELGSEKMSTKTCGVLIKIVFTLFIFSDVHCKILNPVILGKSSYREIMYIYLYLSQIYK